MISALDDSKRHKSWELIFLNSQVASALVSDNANHLKKPVAKWDSPQGQRHIIFQFTKGVCIKDIKRWLHEDNRVQVVRPKYSPRPRPETIENLKKEILKPLKLEKDETAFQQSTFQHKILDGVSEVNTSDNTHSMLNTSFPDVTQIPLAHNSLHSSISSALNCTSFLSSHSNEEDDKLFHFWVKELSNGKTLEQIETEALENEKTTTFFILKKKALFDFFSDLNRRKYYHNIFWPQCQERIQNQQISLNELIAQALKESDMYKFNFLLSKVVPS